MATVDKVYADPSAILKLYLNEPASRAMARWRQRNRGPLAVTHHGRVELINALGLAAHRRLISEPIYQSALNALDDDFQQGRYFQADLLWRAALDRAAELSRSFSRKLGTRSLDVIHVASALEMKFRSFVTFDVRQQELAKAVGLKVVAPRML